MKEIIGPETKIKIQGLETQLAEVRARAVDLSRNLIEAHTQLAEAKAEIERLLKRFEERAPLIPDLQAKVHDLLHSDCCADDPRDGYKKIKAERDLLQSRCDRLERVRVAAEALKKTVVGSDEETKCAENLWLALAQAEESINIRALPLAKP
jgi:chromosome segregation ATPase